MKKVLLLAFVCAASLATVQGAPQPEILRKADEKVAFPIYAFVTMTAGWVSWIGFKTAHNISLKSQQGDECSCLLTGPQTAVLAGAAAVVGLYAGCQASRILWKHHVERVKMEENNE